MGWIDLTDTSNVRQELAMASTSNLPSPTPATPARARTGPWLTGAFNLYETSPKYNVEDFRPWGLPDLTLTDQQQKDMDAYLSSREPSPAPEHTAHIGWVCLPPSNNKKDARIVDSPLKYYMPREPVVCDRWERYKLITLTPSENVIRDTMINAFQGTAKVSLRFTAIRLQRRYCAYGYRTVGKIRFIKELKRKVDEEEAERERVRAEEEKRRMEEERVRKEEEDRQVEEAARRQARTDQAVALAKEGQRKAVEEEAWKKREAEMAKLTVPPLTEEEKERRDAERRRKGKTIALDVDTGTTATVPAQVQFLAGVKHW